MITKLIGRVSVLLCTEDFFFKKITFSHAILEHVAYTVVKWESEFRQITDKDREDMNDDRMYKKIELKGSGYSCDR
jgi:hypothetical protein